MREILGAVVLTVALSWSAAAQTTAVSQNVPPAQCFPLEELAAADRTLALEWLQTLLDREALYTIASDIKPISSGVRTFTYKVENPDLAEIDRARRIVQTFRCGDAISAHVQLFAMESQGQRFAEIIMVNRSAMDRVLEAKKSFFAPLGLSPGTPPLQVLSVVEHLPREARYRGLGHLFGFPDYAVDFFVKATVPGAETGAGKDREFYAVPVYREGGNFFVWAVPIGHKERAEDRAIVERAAVVLKRYRDIRDRMNSEAITILDVARGLLCNSDGLCGAKPR